MLLGALSASPVLLAACSAAAGPLGDGGTPAIQCMDFPQGKPVTTGFFDLENSGKTPVTVTSVALPSSADGLRLSTRSWLVPLFYTGNGGFDDVGVGAPCPPTTAPEWPYRRPAVGSVIRPGQTLNLVFGLTRTGTSDGKTGGPVIMQYAGGNNYTVRELASLIVAAVCH